MVRACHAHFSQQPRYWRARFEDAVSDPATFVKEVCKRFDLDAKQYPFEEIVKLPVRGSSVSSKQREVTWDPVARPRSFNPTGRWQSWPAAKKRTFKRIAGQALLDLGYCENLDW